MSDRSRRRGTTLSVRFLLYYAIAYIVLIGLIGFIIDRSIRAVLIEEVVSGLDLSARLALASLPEDPGSFPRWAEDMSAASGFRFTLIDGEGVVLADSHAEAAALENHRSRPEVLAALEGEVGRAERISSSTGFAQLYVALPPDDGLIVRVSESVREIETELSSVRPTIIAVLVVIGLIGIVVVALLGRRMARPIVELTELSLAVANGDLDVSPRRSRVRELDRLGAAISKVANEMSARLAEAGRAAETLEVVLGAIPQGTVLVATDDRVSYANPAARELLGAIPEILSALAPFPFQTAVREARETGVQQIRVVEHGKPVRHLRGVATPFADDDRVLLVVVDVTERERADLIRRDFVANASHELKTPVSTIIASAEALQIGLERGDPEAASFAGRIEDSARQMSRLVGDLLDLSRLERDTPELSPVRLDLVVNDEVERIRPRAEEKSITLTATCDELTVMANHRDIATAVRNLLDNAIRYTDELGVVAVSVSVDDGEAVLTVTDNGEGIPTRDLDRVFERFYRVDTARSRATGGTGLGLSIVKHVAESHGGSVEVDSELGAGSTFRVRLPLQER